jgi:hypothetical protein
MSTDENERKVIQLDVGGTLYKASRQTLERIDGSMLASLISRQWKESNSNEPIFIDRNGRLLEYVLDYLRTGEVYLPFAVSKDALQKEFEFYGIDADMSRAHETHDGFSSNLSRKPIPCVPKRLPCNYWLL